MPKQGPFCVRRHMYMLRAQIDYMSIAFSKARMLLSLQDKPKSCFESSGTSFKTWHIYIYALCTENGRIKIFLISYNFQ